MILGDTEWKKRQREDTVLDIKFQLAIIDHWQKLRADHVARSRPVKITKQYDELIEIENRILWEKRTVLKQLREGKDYERELTKKAENLARSSTRAKES